MGITPLETYFVIEVDTKDYRVIDDKGEPIPYPKELFEVVDQAIPGGWTLARKRRKGEFGRMAR
jgi:hypothetical protein